MTSSPERSNWQPFALAIAEHDGGMRLVTATPASANPIPDWPPALRAPSEEIAAQAHDHSFRSGYESALDEERGRLEGEARVALGVVARVAEQLVTLQTDFARDRERDLHTLAVAIARQVVQHELTISPERLTSLIQAAIELLPHDPRIEVHLHPSDLAALGDALAGLVPSGRGLDLVWTPDSTMERGGFLLETPQRIIDGRADVALRELWERLGHD